MKTIYFSLFLLVSLQVAFSQPPTLTYETHALLPGANNPMTYCEYLNPGAAGDNITWNFSELKEISPFVGSIKQNNLFKSGTTNANVELEEFGTTFLFSISKSNMKQVGYVSQDKRTKVYYEPAFERMRFPFNYEDNYSTTFGGEYTFDDNKIGDISGNATIEADAWGTLILPNNKTYTQTIRIKTAKSYTTTYPNSASNKVEITTYRWYNQGHRYPLLVLTEYKTYSGENVSTNYQAAYNSNVSLKSAEDKSFTLDENVSVFPNPTGRDLTVQLYSPKDATAQIVIYDLTGKKLIVKNNLEISTGINAVILTKDIENLKPASYVVQVNFDNQTITREVSITD